MLVLQKLFFRFVSILLIGCLTVSCQHSEENTLVHIPSEKFYVAYDNKMPEIKEFVFNDIVLVIDINTSNHEEFITWLGLYSREKGKSLLIESSTLSVGSYRSKLDLLFEVSLSKTSVNNSFYTNSVSLNKISTSSILVAQEQGDSISIEVTIKDNNSTKTIVFNLNAVINDYVIYPT